MREVAAACGILAGSLYHHFPSKEAIAVELVEDYHADLERAVRQAPPPGPDPLAALRAFARDVAAVSAGTGPPCKSPCSTRRPRRAPA